MASRQLLLVAGVAGSFVVSDRGAAQPAPLPTTSVVMASSRSCDGLRELMIDTVVHQSIVGGNAYPQKHYYRHPPRRQGRPGEGAGIRKKKKAAAPRAPAREYDFDDASPAAPAASYSESRTQVNELPAPAGPDHYTKTNIQEKHVDEADIIKTDGKYVYTVRGSELLIAKTWPVDRAEIAARVTFKTIYPQQVYLHGSEIIVQGQTSEQLSGWDQTRTRVIVVDVSNREAPAIKKIIDVDGTAINSRLIRDDLYLVQSSQIPVPPKLAAAAQKALLANQQPQGQSLRPWEAQAQLASKLRTAISNELSVQDLEAALPRVRNGFATQRLSCADLQIPRDNIQTQITTLAKISLVDNDAELVGAVVPGGQVYASLSNLYVTAPQYTYSAKGAEYGTSVHQFALGDDKTKPAYVASGRVEGTLLNQFSMSEWRGDLRIATTDANMAGNNLFVMRPAGKTLSVIGTLRGMGKGERIYAGRLVGEQGYIVTFRQTDPLYTLDLKDPMNPKVSGELKVNGFSNYIHPIGDGLLLTIGQDADAAGRQLGVHLQVFDVKDPTKPTRKFHEQLGAGSYSTAQNDHKAFLWDPVTKTFAIPLAQNTEKTSFNGLAVFSLDKQSGFKSKGRLDHGTLADGFIDEQCGAQKKAAPKAAAATLAYCNPQYRKQYRAQYPIARSMVVDKFIISMSNIGLEIHALEDLDMQSTLSWTQAQKKVALTR
jgi:uncharacterized secreted protein with C-terminal beta-propeller domain